MGPQRRGRGPWLILAAVAAAACGRGDDGGTAEHIRAVLEGGAPVSERSADPMSPDGTPLNGHSEDAGVSAEAVSDSGVGPAAEPTITLATGDTVSVRSPVVEFYRSRDHAPAWTGRSGLTRAGVRLLGAIGSVTYDGLDPDRYHFTAAQDLAQALTEGGPATDRSERAGDLDLLLTEAFVRAAADVSTGLLDPEAVGLPWRFDRATSDDGAVVERLAAGDDPTHILASLRPATPYYHRLAEGLRALRQAESRGGWPTVPAGETLREGDRDPRVALLRGRLLAGEDEAERQLAARGRSDPEHFDAGLREALERFQARHTLHEDGAFGPNTLASVNVPVGERIQTTRLNLDRWRWLPRELGEEYLLVNVAGFELELVARDSAVESMNVVVGRTANRTPLFRDSLRYVVVNPYWNVPLSIAREEIVPAARQDPLYLERNDYEVHDQGRLLNSYFVSAEALEAGRYQVRQRPGPRNALGNVKFIFPNDMNIYLHDTPAGHLFGQETRAFSYGCIRLERADDLARTLLARYSDRGPDEYDRLRDLRREQWVTLDRKLPIYILYFTAWAREDGTLRFHPDIYERDEALQRDRDALLPPSPS